MSQAETHRSNGTANGKAKVISQAPAVDTKPVDPKADDRLVSQIEKVWRSHQEHGLAARHSIGALLNGELGDPQERQKRGQQVVKTVAGRLSISESEISRMRHLANRFVSVAELQQQHPEVTSWSKCKELLARLNDAAPKEKCPAAPTFRGVIQTLKHLADKITEGPKEVKKEDRKELLSSLKTLTEALARVGVNLRIKQVRKAPTMELAMAN